MKRSGTPIKAKYESVEINRSLKVNGKRPYKIHAQWLNPETDEVHIFDSDNIWFDPTDYITDDEITVLIDKKNPKRYFVDTSFLPRMAS